MVSAFDELVDLIATRPGAKLLVRFRASAESQRRVADLLDREKTGRLTSQELAELDRFLQFEHIVRVAKARAHLYLKRRSAATGT